MNNNENLYQRYPDLRPLSHNINAAVDLLIRSFANKGKLLICGNGGSAADGEHISGELLKGFRSNRPLTKEERQKFTSRTTAEDPLRILKRLQRGLPAISLASLTSAATAFSNDVDADLAFSQLVYALGSDGDVLMAISTSGNSPNICLAAQTARGIGMDVIGLTGEDGGSLARHCTCLINVPERETYLVQEYHLPVYHHLCSVVEERIFGSRM